MKTDRRIVPVAFFHQPMQTSEGGRILGSLKPVIDFAPIRIFGIMTIVLPTYQVYYFWHATHDLVNLLDPFQRLLESKENNGSLTR